MGANVLAAALAVALGRLVADEMPEEMAKTLAVEHYWLVFATIMFMASFWIAWRYRTSFPISTSRMLAWAVIGYLGISHTVDIVGYNYPILWEIIGVSPGSTEAGLLTALRARLLVFAVIIGMSITSIAIGFEASEGEDV
jgi:hypothetical protein